MKGGELRPGKPVFPTANAEAFGASKASAPAIGRDVGFFEK